MKDSERASTPGLVLVLLLGLACSAELDLGSDLERSDETGATPLACEPVLGKEFVCAECAQNDCCAELELCAGQPNCRCFQMCLGEGNDPGTCEATCESSSGTAAVVSCLAMACASECGGPR